MDEWTEVKTPPADEWTEVAPTAQAVKQTALSPDQQKQYHALLKSPDTTPEALSAWGEEQGFGPATNAKEVVDYYRQYKDSPLPVYYNQIEPGVGINAEPSTPAVDEWVEVPTPEANPMDIPGVIGFKEVGDYISEKLGPSEAWSIDPVNRRLLGADGPVDIARPVTDLPANIAQLGWGAMRALGVGLDVGTDLLDAPLKMAGVERNINNPLTRPGEVIDELLTNPMLGMETGVPHMGANPVDDIPRVLDNIAQEIPGAAEAAPYKAPRGKNQLKEHTKVLQAKVDETTASWKGGPAYTVVDTVDNVPDVKIRDAINGSANPKGVEAVITPDGKVHIIAKNIKDPARIPAIVFHEGLGHHGMTKLFGSKLDDLLRAFYNTNDEYRGKADAWIKRNKGQYGGDVARAMDEVLAGISEKGALPPPAIMDKLKNLIKNSARKAGMKNVNYSDREIMSILGEAHNRVINGDQTFADGVTRFITAWHGTPADKFDNADEQNPHGKFDDKYMNTGEGAQAFGWGHYVAENQDIAKGTYRDGLLARKSPPKITINGFTIKEYVKNETDIPPEYVTTFADVLKDLLKQDNHPEMLSDAAATYRTYIEADTHKLKAWQHVLETDPKSEIAQLQIKSLNQRILLDKVRIQAFQDILSTEVQKEPMGKGSLFQVYLPDDKHWFSWDKPIEGPAKDAFERLGIKAHYTFKRQDHLDIAHEQLKTMPEKWARIDEAFKKSGVKDRDEFLNAFPYWGQETYNLLEGQKFWEDSVKRLTKEKEEVESTVLTGKQMYYTLADRIAAERGLGYGKLESQKLASKALAKEGIPGHKFLDGGSRSKGEGSHNYVIYDPDTSGVKIEARFSSKQETHGEMTRRHSVASAKARKAVNEGKMSEKDFWALLAAQGAERNKPTGPVAPKAEQDAAFEKWAILNEKYYNDYKEGPAENASKKELELYFKGHDAAANAMRRAEAAYYRSKGDERQAVHTELEISPRTNEEQARVNKAYSGSANDNYADSTAHDWSKGDPDLRFSSKQDEDGGVKNYFHGTAEDFTSFDLSKAGSKSGGPAAEGAVWFSSSPKIASGYAKTSSVGGLKGSQVKENPVDTTDFLHVDAGGKKYSSVEVAKHLQQAKDEGRPGVVFKNADDSIGGINGTSDVVAVFDTSRIQKGTTHNLDPRKGETARFSSRDKKSLTPEKMETKNDVDELIELAAAKAPKGARVSQKETKARAEELGLTTNAYLNAADQEGLAAQIHGAHTVLTSAMDELAGLGERAQTEGVTPALRKEIGQKLATAMAVYAKFDKNTAEIGRALNILKVAARSKDFAKDIAKFSSDGGIAALLGDDEALMRFLKTQRAVKEMHGSGAAAKFLKIQTQALPEDYIKTVIFNSMLSSPVTWIKNTVGSPMNFIMDLISDTSGSVIGKVPGMKAGASGRELVARLYGPLQAFSDWQLITNVQKALVEGKNTKSKPFYQHRTDIMTSLKTGSALKTPSHILAGVDELWANLFHKSNLNGLAVSEAMKTGKKGADLEAEIQRLTANPTAEMLEEADKITNRQLFRGDPSKVTQWIQDHLTPIVHDQTKIRMVQGPSTTVRKPEYETVMRRDKKTGILHPVEVRTGSMIAETIPGKMQPVGKTVRKADGPIARTAKLGMSLAVPFTQTLEQIAKTLIKNSSVAGLILPEVRKDLMTPGPKRNSALGRMALSTAFMAWLWDQAEQGNVTGIGSSNYQKQDEKSATRPPMSIKVGNKWLPYAGYDPLAGMVAAVASAQERYKDVGESVPSDIVTAFIVGMTQSLMKSSYADSVSNLLDMFKEGFDVVRGKDSPKTATKNFVGGQAANITNPAFVRWYTQKFLDPNQRDISGDGSFWSGVAGRAMVGYKPTADLMPVKHDVYGRPMVNMRQDRYVEKDPAVLELARLSKMTPDTALVSEVKRSDLRKLPKPIYAKDLQAYQKLSGQYIVETVRQLMDSGEWNKMTDQEKYQKVVVIRRDMRANAREELFPKHYGEEADAAE